MMQKPPIEEIPGLDDAIEKARRELSSEGRVLVRYSGTQPMARVMIEGEEHAQIVAWLGDVTLCVGDRVFVVAQRRLVFEYGFCGTCGSTLFWRAEELPDWISIAAGTLDPPTGLTTESAWWTREASDYHRLDPALAHHDREP